MATKRKRKSPSSSASTSSAATPAASVVRKAQALLRRIARYASDGGVSQLEATPTEIAIHEAAYRLVRDAERNSVYDDPSVQQWLIRVQDARAKMGDEARASRELWRNAEHARLNALELKRHAEMGSYEKELAILGTGSGHPSHRRHH